MKKIEGLIAAAFTPFNEDGSLNKPMIPVLVDKLVADGVKGIFCCGSNGEGPNMTTEERMEVAEEFVRAARKRLLVIIHVGHSSIAEAKILSAHAAEIGQMLFHQLQHFILNLFQFKILPIVWQRLLAQLLNYHFYYYHIPHLTGVGMDMIEFLKCAGPMISNLAGIKYTATTIQEYQACLNYENGRFDILYGLDELLLPAMAVGAKGAIGSTYTFAAPLYLKTIAAFNSGNIEAARAHHAYMVEVIRVLVKYPPIPGQKAIMKMLGWDLGPSRLPLVTLNKESYNKFYNELNKLSFFEKAPSGKTVNTL
jgi:N-acetylneuraminate lyase